MDGDAGLTGMHRGAADLRAEIEAARRSLAEAAEALAARAPAPIESPAKPEPATEPGAGTELVPVRATLPVPYRSPTRRRSAAFAGALLTTAAVLLRRRRAR